ASTDAGIPNVFHADLPKTLDVFSIMAELSPAETLTAATRNAAEALGVSDQLGRIKKGLSADLILVEGDPLTSLQEVETPVEVFLKGHATLGLFAK
ncbi:MAG: amidohydrolase family protein, partial [Pseudomonadales bacterium]